MGNTNSLTVARSQAPKIAPQSHSGRSTHQGGKSLKPQPKTAINLQSLTNPDKQAQPFLNISLFSILYSTYSIVKRSFVNTTSVISRFLQFPTRPNFGIIFFLPILKPPKRDKGTTKKVELKRDKLGGVRISGYRWKEGDISIIPPLQFTPP